MDLGLGIIISVGVLLCLTILILALRINICFKRLRRDFKIIENRNKELEAENLKLKWHINVLKDPYIKDGDEEIRLTF